MSAQVKRTIRTIVQTGIALAAGLPLILQASGATATTGGVVLALAVAGAVTRIMALPVVESILSMVGLGFAVQPESTPVGATSDGGATGNQSEVHSTDPLV